MIIRLKRFSYGRFETEGRLIIGDKVFATIERPWIPNPNGAKGGKPFESCIPDGMYRLAPHTRPSGAKCFIIFNDRNSFDDGIQQLITTHNFVLAFHQVLGHHALFASQGEFAGGAGGNI